MGCHSTSRRRNRRRPNGRYQPPRGSVAVINPEAGANAHINPLWGECCLYDCGGGHRQRPTGTGRYRGAIVKIADRIYRWAAQPIEADIEAWGIARALEWARRKADAERDGVPFHEPPPEPMPPSER